MKRKIHKYTEILKQMEGFLVFAPSLFLSFQPHEYSLIDLPKSITNLFVCSLLFHSKILRSNMAARAPTRTTVAHGSATSMVAYSRRRTTPTHIRPTKNAFTSWKVQQNSLPSHLWDTGCASVREFQHLEDIVFLKPRLNFLLHGYWAAAWHLLSKPAYICSPPKI